MSRSPLKTYIFSVGKTIMLSCILVLSAVSFIDAASLLDSNFQDQTVSLSDALDVIAETYGVSIIYDVDQMANNRAKDWSIQKKNVEAELKALLKGSNFTFVLLSEGTYVIKLKPNIANPSSTTNQESSATNTKLNQKPILSKKLITVIGKVFDIDTNEPLIGVNILVQESGLGTATDFNGSFSLEVEENATLEFSYWVISTKLLL